MACVSQTNNQGTTNSDSGSIWGVTYFYLFFWGGHHNSVQFGHLNQLQVLFLGVIVPHTSFPLTEQQ